MARRIGEGQPGRDRGDDAEIVASLKLRSDREQEIARDCLDSIREIAEHTDLVDRDFPIEKYEDQFDRALRESEAVLVQAQTGAGKSLSLGVWTLSHLEEHRGEGNVRVAMTQPRRDAAKAVTVATAARFAGMQFGRDICFTTSEFHGNNRETSLQIQTTQVLANKFRNDTTLRQYDAVVIDEAHERDLNIDLVLGLVKRANHLRAQSGQPLLKVVVASATIDKEKFQNYFGIKDEHALQVEGRLFPVDEHFPDPADLTYAHPSGEEKERPYTTIAIDRILSILESTDDGDILVFMPGLRTIREIQNELAQLQNARGKRVQVLGLHSSFSQHERNTALSPGKRGTRRVIVSTNMAETSVTVPGVKYVVDSCRKNQSVFDPETRLSSLQEVPVSKAESTQRKGRAGRVEDGHYYPLISREQFEALDDQPTPDIKRLDITSVVLQMIRAGITDVEDFDFIDKPNEQNLKEALHLLYTIGAIDKDRRLTPEGEVMADMPLEPRMARVVVEAQKHSCVPEVVAVSQMLSGKNLNKRPSVSEIKQSRDQWKKERGYEQSERDAVGNIRSRYRDKQASLATENDRGSDWGTALAAFNAFRSSKNREGFCHEYGYDFDQMRYVMDQYGRIMEQLRVAGIERPRGGSVDDIALSLCAGFAPDHLIKKTGRKHGVQYERLDRGDLDVRINSTSHAMKASPEMAVCMRLQPGKGTRSTKYGSSETTWKYAVGLQPIGSTMLERALPQIVRRTDTPEYVRVSVKDGIAQTTASYEFQRKDGMWVRLPEDTVIERSRAATRELARYIAGSSDPAIQKFFHIQENKDSIQTVTKLFHKSKGTVPLFLLDEWIAGQLGESISMQEAMELNPEGFLLNVEDICPSEQRENIEKNKPDTLQYGGYMYALTYAYEDKSWNDRHKVQKVTIGMPGSNLEDSYHAARLLEKEIEPIRSEILSFDDDDELIVVSEFFGTSFPSIESYILKLREHHAAQLFEEFKKVNERVALPGDGVGLEGPLPGPEAFGVLPLQYGISFDQKSLIAYPAVCAEVVWSGDKPHYFIQYFQNEEHARQAAENAENLHTTAQRAALRESDMRELPKPARDIHDEVKARLDTVEKSLDRDNLFSEELSRIRSKLQGDWSNRTESLISHDPRRAIVQMWEASDMISNLEGHIAQVRALREKLSKMSEKVTIISDDAYAGLIDGIDQEIIKEKWSHVNQLLALAYSSYDVRNMTFEQRVMQAEEMIQELTGILAGVTLPEHMDLYTKMKEWGTAAKYVYVQNGKAAKVNAVDGFKLGDAFSIQESRQGGIPIGTWGKKLIFQANGDVLYFGRAHDWFEGNFRLPDGHWVIGEGANEMLRVSISNGHIQPDELYEISKGAGGNYSENFYEETRGGGTSEIGTVGESMGTLADLLSAKKQEKPEPVKPAVVIDMTPRSKEKKEDMTDELKAEFFDHLAKMRALIDGMRPYMGRADIARGKQKRVKEKKHARGREKQPDKIRAKKQESTENTKAMADMYEKYASFKAEAARLAELLERGADVASLRGQIATLEGKIESAYKRNMPKIEENYDQGWFDVFNDQWRNVEATIAANEEVMDYILDGFVTRADLVAGVKKSLEESVEDIQQGIPFSIDDVIEDVLAELV
ncbi:MAG: hypothetical protein COU35_02110 [Candidatus Magasanikbacteria bacterium CG10_big_fil_rev_8_21_14_0_10_47_10]|uniref:Helicase n=1 Tax=Candidatus Magasanikbacteria bacterium CG10_big_fil_rev_8_21_14_0_10_47_10 TaxID=1974652 RepID=A0A2H0TSM4_9BACT|nr:MAG: hypothetical protein COU35_02110 [Candidatus Magasanikbacteria bacterium CG10_big_fil_rev_8_21_14_0_10_47_10]